MRSTEQSIIILLTLTSTMDEQYVIINEKKYRRGYTTGSCATAAAIAAARTLLMPENSDYGSVELVTPNGTHLTLQAEDFSHGADGSVRCGVRKDAGDDPDVTDGIMVYATVSKSDIPGIFIDGGEGVGRVTRKGLDQPVGNAAINSVPRQCIADGCLRVLREEYSPEDGDAVWGLSVIIDIPGGEEIAEKTFNPRLGIIGGISVIGTGGTVEPMSEKALLDSIRVEIKVMAAGLAEGHPLYMTPGNYGMDFAKKNYGINLDEAVKCSNYIGDAIDMARECGIRNLVLIGHIGKLVKTAGGIMNTHSKNADSRMEIIAAAMVHCGMSIDDVRNVLECVTTDEALSLIDSRGMLSKVCQRIGERASFYLNKRAGDSMHVKVIIFSNEYGRLSETE